MRGKTVAQGVPAVPLLPQITGEACQYIVIAIVGFASNQELP
jgi:hypothetical protein